METKLKLIQQHIDTLLLQHDSIVIAIDGNCTAGKTTLAAKLSDVYDCNVFHMDDFFLRPEQRTPERFAQPGGNIDYERFAEEVLIPLMSGKAFSYCPFNCKTFTISDSIRVTPKRINIIEGSYSHHPYFKDPYNLKIFMTVTPEVQRQRILQRPPFLHQRFFEEWIPMELQYFEAFCIHQLSDVCL